MKDLLRSRRLSYDIESDEAARVVGRSVGSVGRRVNPSLSASALSAARNALDAAHVVGDYRHKSIGDLIREALLAYGSGLRLTEQSRGGPKQRHTVKLSSEIYAEYEKIPNRMRGEIIERALLSLLAGGLP